jgi:DNA-binding NarL/FixJ family response regulator
VSNVLVYSDDAAIRESVRMAIGRRPDPELDPIDYIDAHEGRSLIATVDKGGIDVCILDGEAWPTGGLGVARQMRDELSDCPAILVLVARRDDAWLCSWSKADAYASRRMDPMELTEAVVTLLRNRASQVPALRP